MNCVAEWGTSRSSKLEIVFGDFKMLFILPLPQFLQCLQWMEQSKGFLKHLKVCEDVQSVQGMQNTGRISSTRNTLLKWVSVISVHHECSMQIFTSWSTLLFTGEEGHLEDRRIRWRSTYVRGVLGDVKCLDKQGGNVWIKRGEGSSAMAPHLWRMASDKKHFSLKNKIH